MNSLDLLFPALIIYIRFVQHISTKAGAEGYLHFNLQGSKSITIKTEQI
jgi:hypothetical protein